VTLLIESHQLTNQPTDHPRKMSQNADFSSYVSGRINLAHSKLQILIDVVFKGISKYIAYPHTSDKNVQHFHFMVPCDPNDKKFCEKLRKRCRSIDGVIGKMDVRCKIMSNGIPGFVAYVKHEKGTPVLKGYEREWFDSIEPLEKKNIGSFLEKTQKGQPRNPDHFKQITYSNFERVTLRYRRENGIASTQLEDTLEHMHANGWRLQITVLRQGIPESLFEQFTAQCKGETIYCAGRFNRMKKYENWKEHNDRY
jgi:hypothetical protein